MKDIEQKIREQKIREQKTREQKNQEQKNWEQKKQEQKTREQKIRITRMLPGNSSKTILKIILGMFLFYVIFELWSSVKWLSVEHFSMVSDKIEEPIRLVVLSDLHNACFGKENQRFVDRIEEQNPDCIFMVGDMLNKNSKNADRVVHLVQKLSETTPVYYALGNHEIEYERNKKENLTVQLEKAGAIVLDKTYKDVKIKNNPVRIGAMYEYAFQWDKTKEEYKKSRGYQFMKEFENTDNLKLFLTHRPESFLWSRGKDKDNWQMDAVFSGHVHGGQIRIPFAGGLYGIEQGWFPKYYDGKYKLGESQLLITRGLGTNLQPVPRMWNRPQIMVVDCKSGIEER